METLKYVQSRTRADVKLCKCAHLQTCNSRRGFLLGCFFKGFPARVARNVMESGSTEWTEYVLTFLTEPQGKFKK